MKTLLMVLFYLTASAQTVEKSVKAVWVEAPIPHWSCPKYLEVYKESEKPPERPTCVHVVPNPMYLGYDPDKQEKISWKWALQLDERGRIHVSYKEGFIKMPGCKVTDREDTKAPIHFSDENIRGITLTGKPKHVVLLECSGLISRKI